MPHDRERYRQRKQAKPHGVPVVDLFSGPGGLSEGFASVGLMNADLTDCFDPVLAYEKDACAVRTLSFRKLFHAARQEGLLADYFAAVAADPTCPEAHLSDSLAELFVDARARVRDVTLQESERPRVAKEVRAATAGQPWVLLGGPPCQAYSLVGRARNRGVAQYDPALDARNTLYEEYLHVLASAGPDVFVLENVKGLLSATVGDSWIFGKMLSDLTDPAKALGGNVEGPRYRIYSLVDGTELAANGTAPNSKGAAGRLDLRATVVRMEDYGVPQARHRVLLLGIRSDLDARPQPLRHAGFQTPIEYVISDLPALRSRFSGNDSAARWTRFIRSAPVSLWRRHLLAAANGSGPDALEDIICRLAAVEVPPADFGGSLVRGLDRASRTARALNAEGHRLFERSWRSRWSAWYRHGMGGVRWFANHQSRGHMPEDLHRYVFAASYARLNGAISPRIKDFPKALRPDHRNVDRAVSEGLFADRFKVQLAGRPSSTITSHIHKDGHYFIHFDPTQARSFTVREAARAQTFSDSYVFLGPRTEQFRQVGNAVPPYLAAQIALVVFDVLRQARRLHSR
jgi:DNA (cytosine-5)-methyltransferase 1